MSQEVIALCAALLSAKAVEAQANAARVAIEEQIVAAVGKRDEGSQTQAFGEYKVTTTGKVSRKMDWAAWDAIKATIPADMHPVKDKPELDEKGVKWLQTHRADLYKLLPIEVKPAKTAVEVKFTPNPAP